MFLVGHAMKRYRQLLLGRFSCICPTKDVQGDKEILVLNTLVGQDYNFNV